MAVRKAGQSVKKLAGGNPSDSDWVATLALLGGTGALGAAGLAGLVDLFAGSSNIGNSGGNEYMMNSVINTIPVATTVAGVGAAAVMDPISRAMVASALNKAAAKTAGERYGSAAMESYLGGAAPNAPAAEAEQAVNSVAESRRRLAELVAAEVNKAPGLSAEQQMMRAKEVIRRGNRNVAIGGGLGAILGAVPAIAMMQDAPAGRE